MNGPSSSEPVGGPPSPDAPIGETGGTAASGDPTTAGTSPPDSPPASSTNAPSTGSGSTAAPAPPPGAIRWDARDQRRAARDERRELRRQRRDGTGALVAGLVLILIGGYFLVRTYLPSIDVDRAWPVILIAIGVVLLARSVRGPGSPPA